MLIKNDFEVTQPVEKVWQFFDNIPAVASCLPGTEITKELGDDKYEGKVAVRMGPVKLQFDGIATITERDEAAKRIVVQASGAETKGKGQAEMRVAATLARSPAGTKVAVTQDLQLSGAAAQYGRGMIADVSSVLMGEFSATMQDRITRAERGEDDRHHVLGQPGPWLPLRPQGRAARAEPGLPPLLPALPAQPDLRREPWSCGGSATPSCWWSSCPSS